MLHTHPEGGCRSRFPLMNESPLPAPPACPDWCQAQHPHGWDVQPTVTVKACGAHVEAPNDIDGEAAAVEIHRFVFADCGEVEMEDPTIQVYCLGRLSHIGALHLAEALISAAGMVADSLGESAAA